MDAGQTLQLGIRRLFEAEFPPALRELAHQGRHENLRAARFCGDACSKDHRLAVEVVGFLVTTDQSPQMAAALIAAGVPARLFTVLGNGGAESGSTASGVAGGPLFAAAGQKYASPSAGHGWEGSDTHLVIKTGFDQLFALMAGSSVPTGETFVPGV